MVAIYFYNDYTGKQPKYDKEEYADSTLKEHIWQKYTRDPVTGFNSANLLSSDVICKSLKNLIVSFALPFKTTKCYHCTNAGRDDNHEKTAGCYTGKANGNYEVIIMK